MTAGVKTGVIHYGAGNTGSVLRALERIGSDVELVDSPEELGNFSSVLLPGVGSFSKAMRNLVDRGWVDHLRHFVDSGRPLAGICLGMQLLMDSGDEGGFQAGLGFIHGKTHQIRADARTKLPHMGWNSIEIRREHNLLSGIRPSADYYFAHSYVVDPLDAEVIVATTVCGQDFPSIIAQDNVVGFQFHPEKSPPMGKTLLRNFLEWNP